MGLYSDKIFPRVMNTMMNTKENRRVRSEVCRPLHGEILEIGFGTGLNLPHLPAAVAKVNAVDPLAKGRDLAAERLAASSVTVDFVGLDGQQIPLDDATVDVALSTWTLCSIPDPIAAVREVSRILRPGGTFHFVEHGRSPDEKVHRWQVRMNGIQHRVACGCSLTCDIPGIIRDGGMTIDQLDTGYAKGEPKVFGWTFRGVASVPAPA
jgi:ubiquinone/menaquinone biosynthesis C-methylase UbiE